jgi:hypothetical protein
MSAREPYDDVGTIDAEDVGRGELHLPAPSYPAPPGPAAFRGVFGELVEVLEPHTEADRSALLVHGLVAFGSVIGRGAHFVADATPHHTNLFAVVVAASSKGRKGTAWSHIKRIFQALDPTWRIVSGLASGEGLIWHVRDPHYVEREIKQQGRGPGQRERVLDDAGVDDKRLFIAEPEFARVLRVCERDGATLSPVLREAWDSGNLASLTRNCPARATGAHVSLVGHITAEELRRYLTATEAGNGFGNRFLWVCARRSKYLPDGGRPNEAALLGLMNDFRLAVERARGGGELRRDRECQFLWHDVYPDLSDGRHGLLGSMTGRAEAQVMRLACLYALADASPNIEADHLKAALALWRYCFESARFIFGEALGNKTADDLLAALKSAGSSGLTRTEMNRDIFGQNRSTSEIGRALTLLNELGLARGELDRSGAGRPVERWFALAGVRVTN